MLSRRILDHSWPREVLKIIRMVGMDIKFREMGFKTMTIDLMTESNLIGNSLTMAG